LRNGSFFLPPRLQAIPKNPNANFRFSGRGSKKDEVEKAEMRKK
jgi:hypothetical protein